jgi:heme-degrading monooxygenase HmoA
MHAVVVNVTIKEFGPALEALRSQVVPRVSQAPGFRTGYWLRSEENRGLSVIVFESEDAAKAAAEQVQAQGAPTDAVTLDSVEVREVVANA